MTQGPPLLSGTTVLDLTTFLSGPFGAQLLGDFGARIVKIESRVSDLARDIPPHFVAGDSAYFHAINRNKQSIQIDLKHPSGHEVFLDLVRRADVVLENFRPGVMSRLGLSFDELCEANPRIIVGSISGFGSHGPYRDRPAYDAIVQAMSGGMSLTGHPDSPPARMGIPIGDLAAGLYAAAGVAAALVRRERHGVGEHLEISMLDCQVALLGYQAAYYLFSGEVPGPQGAGHVSIPTYRSFLCGDGRYVLVTANTEAMWRSLCEALGRTELCSDARFATNADRLEHRHALWPILEEAFLEVDSDEAVELLAAAKVPVAPVNTVADALTDPHVIERDMVVTLDGPDGASVRVPGNPVKTHAGGALEPPDMSFAPGRGRDTARVLSELLGMDRRAIASLREQGAVGPFRAPHDDDRS